GAGSPRRAWSVPASGGSALLLFLDIGGDGADAVEIGRDDLAVGDLDPKTLLDVEHQLEHASGIHITIVDQRGGVLDRLAGIAEEEVLDDEVTDIGLDISHCCPVLPLVRHSAAWVAAFGHRVNSRCQIWVERIPT